LIPSPPPGFSAEAGRLFAPFRPFPDHSVQNVHFDQKRLQIIPDFGSVLMHKNRKSKRVMLCFFT